ncbi:hypothetical protein HOLleu_02320 [Holothuria leucospilota]|uniref:Uncharacterized protein n=1 Tax=Holothuria leucospilota TaxID=206669 RepID=A0A9Q1CRL4_HOLLE|nr:hypothetical protein HOLleu_02320 [Holothuria leucospilota]
MKKKAGLDGLDFKSKPKSESRVPESESKSKSRERESKSKSEFKKSGLKSGLEVESGLESSSPANSTDTRVTQWRRIKVSCDDQQDSDW